MIDNTKKLSMTTSIILIVLILSSFVASFNVKAEENNVLEVNQNGNYNYTSIREAINNAKEGDIVYVYNGIYYENLLIDKSINLVGENQEETIIDGQEKTDVILITANYVNITGFTIQNAGFYLYNNGIDVDSSHNIIANNTIQRCRCGIALELWPNDCRIFKNTFYENSFGIMAYSIHNNRNLIYENNFLKNYHNAYDDSKGQWSYNGQGNYWDDYNGTDNDGDGVGDTPYEINGGTTKDHYPLIEPVQTPGFEIILMIAAIVTMYIFKRRNKGYL